MIGLVVVIAVLAAVAFALLRYHPTMRYPAYVVQYGGSRFIMRPDKVRVWLRKQKPTYTFPDVNEDYFRRMRVEMMIAERYGMAVIKPDALIKIAGI